MNIIFYSPLFLSALLAVPALVAIYLLRNKFRTYVVSTLMLWIDQKKPRQGGLQVSRIQTPLLFVLELMVIILLALSAAGIMLRSKNDTRIFFVVLDDSFSMLASDGKSAKEKAIEQIKNILTQSGNCSIRFILAGSQPQLLGSPVTTIRQVDEIFQQWKCRSPAADLAQAVSLASQLAGQTARILVITDGAPNRIFSRSGNPDHKPGMNIEQGRLEWQAFGKYLGNIAFVNASRSQTDGNDRCLLTVANFSEVHKKPTLVIKSLDNSKIYLQKALELQPHEEYNLIFEPQDNQADLKATLENDNLNIDNEVILLRQPEKTVRVQLNIKNQPLLSAVKRAVDAAKNTQLNTTEPGLFITDSSSEPNNDLWTIKIISEPNVSGFVGPFIIDQTHPLSAGLSLNNVIWAAPKTENITAIPVIAAGNVPLVIDKQSPSGSHNITLWMNPQFSTLMESPDWPILFWNLVNWRRDSLPGLEKSNYQLGSTVIFTPDFSVKDLYLTDPVNNTKKIPASAGKAAAIDTYYPGLYKLSADKSSYSFTVNGISAAESNLAEAVEGKWGQWQQASFFWWEYKNLDIPLLLAALLLLSLHRLITARQMKGDSYDIP
jgi:hypothetical protein